MIIIIWELKKVTVIPIVIGALGAIPKRLVKGLVTLEIGRGAETIQTSALLRLEKNLGDLKTHAVTQTSMKDLQRYLLRAPPNGQVWHKAFFGGSGRRAVAHTHPAFPKNAYGPVGIPLIRGASGPGRLTQPPRRE